jgi:adenylyl-sulfate kinase
LTGPGLIRKVTLAEWSIEVTQRPFVLWFTGLSASGKTTLATLLSVELAKAQLACFVLDGDRLRSGLCSDLGFSAADRAENIRRAGEVARLLVEAGLIVIVALISPYASDRARVRGRFDRDQFYEIFLECSIEVCRKRDPKGLYLKAEAGIIPSFTGITDPYERPSAPELVLRTGELTIEESLEILVRFVSELRGSTYGRGTSEPAVHS